LTEKDYYDRIEAVKENYEISKRFKRTNEDQIIDDVLTYLTNLEKEQ